MRPSRVTFAVMMCVSGFLNSEADAGSVICSFSGGWNCVVVMKKMSSRNATSTSGVMSIAIPIRLLLILPTCRLLRARREVLHRLERRLVDHVAEVVHLGREHVVEDDAHDRDDQAAGGVDERLGDAERELRRVDRARGAEGGERADHAE